MSLVRLDPAPDTTGWDPEPGPGGGTVFVSPDGLTVYSPHRGRFYRRSFDRRVAREWYALGYTLREIATTLGVSPAAVEIAVSPEVARKNYEHAQAFIMSGVCELCGGPTIRERHRRKMDGRLLCRTCRAIADRTAVRIVGGVVEVRCMTCREYKIGDEFYGGRRYRDLRDQGFANQCRACMTEARRAYRNRHKVPCQGGCGKLVEGSGRANTRTGHTGKRARLDPDRPYICHDCYHAARRAA